MVFNKLEGNPTRRVSSSYEYLRSILDKDLGEDTWNSGKIRPKVSEEIKRHSRPFVDQIFCTFQVELSGCNNNVTINNVDKKYSKT